LCELGRALDVGEQCRDRFPFALEILRRWFIGYLNRRAIRFPWQSGWRFPKRGGTFPAEVLARLIRSAASWTQECEWSGALRAKFAPFAVVSSALRAAHQSPLIRPVTPATNIALRIHPAMICTHR